jgi:seryl-tRNA synthetase
MLDPRFVKENIEMVNKTLKERGMKQDLAAFEKFFDQRRKVLREGEELKRKRNEVSEEIGGLKKEKKDASRLISQMQKVSSRIKEKEEKLRTSESKLKEILSAIPNIPLEGVPRGEGEADNAVLRQWGEPRKFNFKPRDHIEIGKKLDIIDLERGARTSGARFSYLKNEGVLLEIALLNFTFDLLLKEGFSPVIPPVLVKEEVMKGAGYLYQAEEEIYKTVLDNLYLVGTSEQSLLALHMGEILAGESLPLRYAGFSTCFRREAGSYGKDVRGIFRVHQFDKVEMFSFCRPEESSREHEYLLSREEKIMQALEIPYQVVSICSGDLGMPAAKKYDLEAYMPGQDKYRETHSCSNCTDYQSRGLNIRYRSGKEPSRLVHTLNGTAVAMGRMIIAILENYQEEDASVVIPKVLRPYTGGLEKIKNS